MTLPLLPTNGAQDSTLWRRVLESINGILKFDFDDSRVRTKEEQQLGIYPVNYAYEPGNVLRYDADPTGESYSDFAFNCARQVTGYRGGHVPLGTYKITGLTGVQGMWGEGEVYGNGTERLYIPRSQQEFGSLQRIYGQLQKVRGWNSMVAIMGDSICEGYDSGPFTGGQISNAWFYRFTQGIMWLTEQIGQPGAVTNFNDPTRYGLNLAGSTSVGTAGPVKASLVMTPGSTITFTGTFPRIAVWAQQSAGAGKLELRLNGTLYDTLDYSGSTASDVVKISSANAGTSGTHVITCTTANVEVTAILQSVGAPSNTTWPIYMAKSGESSSLFDSTTLTSVRTILHGPNNPTSGRALVFFQMLLNDYLDGSATAKTSLAYRAKLERIFSALTADGHQVIMVIPPRPDEATRPGYLGETFAPYATRAREAAEAYGIPVIDANAYDMNGEGYLPDGVHPSTAGHEQMFRTLIEQLAELDSYSQPYMVGLREYTPDVSAQNSYTARTGWYYAQGGLIHVWGQITINTAVSLGGGSLTVSLPIKSANSVLPSGTAGPTFGWAASVGLVEGINTPAGYTQLVANVTPNGSLLYIRCIDPDSGTRNDVSSLSNSAVINFYACYPRGE
jgi:lysophospholipase L1-like esterase